MLVMVCFRIHFFDYGFTSSINLLKSRAKTHKNLMPDYGFTFFDDLLIKDSGTRASTRFESRTQCRKLKKTPVK